MRGARLPLRLVAAWIYAGTLSNGSDCREATDSMDSTVIFTPVSKRCVTAMDTLPSDKLSTGGKGLGGCTLVHSAPCNTPSICLSKFADSSSPNRPKNKYLVPLNGFNVATNSGTCVNDLGVLIRASSSSAWAARALASAICASNPFAIASADLALASDSAICASKPFAVASALADSFWASATTVSVTRESAVSYLDTNPSKTPSPVTPTTINTHPTADKTLARGDASGYSLRSIGSANQYLPSRDLRPIASSMSCLISNISISRPRPTSPVQAKRQSKYRSLRCCKLAFVAKSMAWPISGDPWSEYIVQDEARKDSAVRASACFESSAFGREGVTPEDFKRHRRPIPTKFGSVRAFEGE